MRAIAFGNAVVLGAVEGFGECDEGLGGGVDGDAGFADGAFEEAAGVAVEDERHSLSLSESGDGVTRGR
jgi:hypothetical protein